MKLRNKKTGEIRDFIINKDKILTSSTIDIWEYNSLAELNEEWEDYEELKGYWYMSNRGDIRFIDDEDTEWDNQRKEIGNYFETKEEAEKAVEKLKAWKRLKDKGFKFEEWDNDQSRTLGDFVMYASIKCLDDIIDDLNFLFRGE